MTDVETIRIRIHNELTARKKLPNHGRVPHAALRIADYQTAYLWERAGRRTKKAATLAITWANHGIDTEVVAEAEAA